MNVLVVMGVYSGLADSLASGRWQPRGVPAVYHLLEGLAGTRGLNVTYVFLARRADARFRKTARRPLAPLGDRVWVLPWREWRLFGNSRLGAWLNEVEQTLRVLAIAMLSRTQVAYCANAAFVPASLLVRWHIAPVVLRFLGIFPVHREMAEGRGHRLARWFYRAPFVKVISTLEGSGAEYYLPKLLRDGVPCEVLLNGVDRTTPDASTVAALRAELSPGGRTLIGFLGRLEPFKGCEEFVEALIALERSRPGSFRGLIVGDGPLREKITARAAEAGLGARITFTGALPHAAVAAHLAATDIYVSLNRYGNLSNANLEAMAAGCCMLFLDEEPREHIDEVTTRMVPRDIVERIPRTGTAAALAGACARLIGDPSEIERRAAATAALADTLLVRWNERIAREIAAIREAARTDCVATKFQIEKAK